MGASVSTIETAALLGALDHAPVLDRALTRLVAVQPFVNFVVTNVPGSPVALHLLESRIETIVPMRIAAITLCVMPCPESPVHR